MQFLFPRNAVASHLIYKLDQFKISLDVLTMAESKKTTLESSSEKDIPKIDGIWDFIFKTYKPRNHSID